jgi:predicted RNase H-like HicB family nuclease
MNTASLKYDFESSSWIVIYDQNPDIRITGTTPEEAVNNLRYAIDKHNLWVK